MLCDLVICPLPYHWTCICGVYQSILCQSQSHTICQGNKCAMKKTSHHASVCSTVFITKHPTTQVSAVLFPSPNILPHKCLQYCFHRQTSHHKSVCSTVFITKHLNILQTLYVFRQSLYMYT